MALLSHSRQKPWLTFSASGFLNALALDSGVFPPTCGGRVCYREASSTHDYYLVLLVFSKTAADGVVIFQRE